MITLSFTLLLCIRSSTAGDQAALKDEIFLCAKSCLKILRAISNSYYNFDLLLNCLHGVAACISSLEETCVTAQGETKPVENLKLLVEESVEIVKKWLKKSLNSQIPCYHIAESEKELKVCFNFTNVVSSNPQTICRATWSKTWLPPHNGFLPITVLHKPVLEFLEL